MKKNKSQFRNTLERTDYLEEHHKSKEEVEEIRKENLKLEFVLNKYNFILNEYQLKYGNELFRELDKQLNIESLESVNNNSTEFKKILVENVSLIKEYEKVILDKNKKLEFLNNELNRFQVDLEKLVEENKALREELEVTKEEHNKLYKSILQQENVDRNIDRDKKSLSGGFGILMSRTSMNNNLTSDIQTNIDLLKSQNEQLLQLIEKTKYESEHHKTLLSEYKEKYEALSSVNDSIEQEYQKLLSENKNLFETKNYAERRLIENNKLMMNSEKKVIETTNLYNKFEIDNKFLKQELDFYKEMNEELEKRKNSELSAVMKELEDLKSSHYEAKTKISILEEQNSDMKFEISKNRQEIQILKYDCDHMTKILEESNFAVNAASEKEKHIDNIVKAYKKKIDEAILEKEKGIVKQRLLEKQILKMAEDYSKLLSEKQSQYENFIDTSKEKFTQIMMNKDEEISNLKNDNLGLKIEKDRYFNEYSTIKKEFDKFSQIFREENDKYIKKFEESDKSANRMQNHLHDKINILVKKVEKFEFEKTTLENELSLYKSTEKNREMLIQKYNKNDESYTREFNKLKERCEVVEKEKELNEKEIERITNLYETKINQTKEQNELRLTVYENTMKSQKEDFDAAEDKAFEMLKKQENITNKFKEEFRNTVYYYENLIEKMLKDTRQQKSDFENNDNFDVNSIPVNYNNNYEEVIYHT